MNDVPETSDSLLIRVRNPQDRDAWDQFSRIYRPAVYRLARGRGLQDADAQDLAQRVLMSVANAITDWRRSQPNAKFRYWLRRVAKNAVVNALTRQPKDRAGGGSTAAQLLQMQHHTEADPADEVELEYRRQVYRRAAEIVRSRADEATWLAFSMTMVDGETISDAARKLGRSEGMVYAARSRMMKRLRDVIRDLEDE